QVETLLRRGIERGELRPDVDPQLAASALMGPVVFRRLLLHEPPTMQRVSAFIDLILQGIARPSSNHPSTPASLPPAVLGAPDEGDSRGWPGRAGDNRQPVRTQREDTMSDLQDTTVTAADTGTSGRRPGERLVTW